MGRKRSSGIFETLMKSVLGVGTTVKYKTSFWGREQKIVTHHDSGKKKTYSHGHGIFGNTTRTVTKQNGRVIERGELRENFFFAGATEHARQPDGTTVKRSYTPGILRDHVRTKVTGECWKCEGTGQFTGSCRLCEGSGLVHLKAKSCFSCNGTGIVNSEKCMKCGGTGEHKPATERPCLKCAGKGTFAATCNKCGGTGRHERTHRE